jgi:hypothetical protein
MTLADLQCPNCGAQGMEAATNGALQCPYCGSSFGQVTRVCPQCGHYNESGVRYCSECGAQLVRECPACGAENWVLADHCVQCGRNLDLIEHLAQRWQQTTEERLFERRAGIESLREEEERASEQRMVDLLEAERIRQEAVALAQRSQQRRDQQVYVLVGVALAIFVLLIIALLLTSGKG